MTGTTTATKAKTAAKKAAPKKAAAAKASTTTKKVCDVYSPLLTFISLPLMFRPLRSHDRSPHPAQRYVMLSFLSTAFANVLLS